MIKMITTSAILNPIFNPMTSMKPSLAIALFSIMITLITTLIYKYTTPQKLLKELRDEMNSLQKRMRELQKDMQNPKSQKEAMKLQSKILLLSGKQFKHSMRSTLITLLPLLLIFGWMSTHFAYEPLRPNQEFNITLYFSEEPKNTSLEVIPEGILILNEDKNDDKVVYTLKGKSGEYLLTFHYDGEVKNKEILITENQNYEKPVETYSQGVLKKIVISNKPLRVKLLGISLSWIWYYLILAMLFSTIFRKMMKVY